MYSDPVEREAFHDIGLRLLNSMVGFSTSTILYGIFVPLFAYSISHAYKSSRTSPLRWVIFGLTILTFILTTIYWILYFVWFILYICHALLLDDGIGIVESTTLIMTPGSRVFKVYKLNR